jgi:hypothetical protein
MSTQEQGAMQTFVLTNSQRGQKMIMSAVMERRPIDFGALADLLNWACSATGDVLAHSITDSGELLHSDARIAASSEPRMRLYAAMKTMVDLINNGLK